MKKSVTLFLSALLLLTGCAPASPTGTQASAGSTAAVTTAAGTTTDKVTFDPANWESVVAAARGTTVTHTGYGGDDALNEWIRGPFAAALAGILPLASARHAAFLQQEVPGIDIPPEIHASMQQAGDQGAREGIRLAIELIGQLKSIAQGVYLMPAFGRFDYAAEIIETVLK